MRICQSRQLKLNQILLCTALPVVFRTKTNKRFQFENSFCLVAAAMPGLIFEALS